MICVTGIASGASSALSDRVKAVRAETTRDSKAWKGGDKLDIIVGVRTRTFGGAGDE